MILNKRLKNILNIFICYYKMEHEDEINSDNKVTSKDNKIWTKLEESTVNENTYSYGTANDNFNEYQIVVEKTKFFLGVELNEGIKPYTVFDVV